MAQDNLQPVQSQETWFSRNIVLLASAAGLLIVAVAFYLRSESPSVAPAPTTPEPSPVAVTGNSAVSETSEAMPALSDPHDTILTANTWTWQFEGAEPRTLKFLSDGTLLQTRFTGSYAMQGEHQVAIRKNAEANAAVLTFRADWSGYEGLDFDGKRKLWGTLIPPVAEFGTGAAALRTALCQTEWTWERLGGRTESVRFREDGTVTHPNFSGTWKLGEDGLVTLTLPGGETALFHLDPKLAGWHGMDFDGQRRVWGRAMQEASAESSVPK